MANRMLIGVLAAVGLAALAALVGWAAMSSEGESPSAESRSRNARRQAAGAGDPANEAGAAGDAGRAGADHRDGAGAGGGVGGGPAAGPDAAAGQESVIGLETAPAQAAPRPSDDPSAGLAPADDPRAEERAKSFAQTGPSSGARSRRDIVSVPSEVPMLVVRVVEADVTETAPVAGTTDRRRPIGGATVRVTVDGTERSETTGPDGWAQFPFPSAVTADVVADAPRRARERRVAVPVSGGKRITLTVAMRVAASAGGIVEGDGAVPVAGVTVRAYRREPWIRAIPYDDDPAPVAETRTSGHGIWRIDSLPFDEPVIVVFSGDNLADRVVEVPPLPDADAWFRRDVRMARGVVHRGVVLDARGAPAAGRMVYAVPGSRPAIDAWLPKHLLERLTHAESAEHWGLVQIAAAASGGRPWTAIRRARTGADGSFAIPGIAAESEVVTIAFPRRGRAGARDAGSDAAPSERRGSASGLMAASARASVRMCETTIAWLSIAGAAPRERVRISPALPWERWTAAWIGPGDAPRQIALDGRVGHVYVDPDEHAPWPMIFCLDEADRASGAAARIALRLRNGRVITGKVCDDRGEPLGGVRISGEGRDTTTAMDGTYTLRHVRAPLPGEPNWNVDVDASLAGHVSAREVAVGDEAVINLRRAAKLRIKFELPKGVSPPPWYRVWIGRYDAVAGAAPQPVPLAIEDLQSGPVPEANRWFQSRSWTGELSVQANPGHNLLVLVAPGFCVHTFAISARPGDEVDLGTLYMRTAGELKGNVVTEEGSPIADAEVATWGGFRPPWADVLVTRVARTDGSGAFRLPLLTPYDDPPLLVCAPGFPRTVTPSDWDPVRNPAGGGALASRREERFATLRRGSPFGGRTRRAGPNRSLSVRFGIGGASVYADVGPDGHFSTVVPLGVESVTLHDAVTGVELLRRNSPAADRWIEFD